mmetsp:Transcript_37155/g.97424  ORF Transcript_37155/g.97424 Transcript_37155/m.97424 type:complete len:178 (-) Transcript_37155:27-560(-)
MRTPPRAMAVALGLGAALVNMAAAQLDGDIRVTPRNAAGNHLAQSGFVITAVCVSNRGRNCFYDGDASETIFVETFYSNLVSSGPVQGDTPSSPEAQPISGCNGAQQIMTAACATAGNTPACAAASGNYLSGAGCSTTTLTPVVSAWGSDSVLTLSYTVANGSVDHTITATAGTSSA